MKNKIFKIGIIITVLMLVLMAFYPSFAADKGTVIDGMKDVTKKDNTIKTDKGVGGVVNIGIGLIQIAGTGISLITITILGARYMLSSPEQKAEIKNRAMPVVIGMVILFGSVNLVAIMADLANTAFA